MTDIKSINHRFLLAIDYLVTSHKSGKLTKGAIGERIGIKQVSNLTRLAKANQGANRSVSVENCARLCAEFNISPEWLLLGKGEMVTSKVKIEQSESGRLESKITSLENRILILEKKILKQ
jgi:HPt (histidine-containing phosphotransfer) domain-containing protein